MIKKYFFCLLILLTFLLTSSAQSATIERLNKIVAIVNSDVITQNELDKRIILINHQSQASNSAALRKQALDSLIDSLLQMQFAKSIGITISEAEIDNAISDIAKKNNLTVEQLKKSLLEYEGLNFREYREQIREQILLGRVEQQVLGKDIVVSEQEVQDVMRHPPKSTHNNIVAQYHVSDVLIELLNKDSSDIAMKIATKLKQGADIEKTIQEYNINGQHITNQDLGIRKINELPTLFAKKIIGMQIGQTVGPIQAPNGLHVLKLLEAQGIQPKEAQFTKDRAQEFVFRQKLEKQLKPWLKELREAAYIKVID